MRLFSYCKKFTAATFILLIPYLAFAQMPFPGWGIVKGTGAGASAYCTSFTSDGSTTYIMCEDFEGSTSCATSEDSNCRATYSVVQSTGEELDFQQAFSGSVCTGTTSSYAAKFTSNSGSASAYYIYDVGSDENQLTTQFYFIINSESMTDGQTSDIFRALASGTTNTAYAIKIKQITADSTLRVMFFYHDGSGGVDVPTTETTAKQISTGQWYRVRILWDNINNDTRYCVADHTGSNEVCLTYTDNTTYHPGKYYIGLRNGGNVIDGQIDNIRVLAGTSYPTACSQ